MSIATSYPRLLDSLTVVRRQWRTKAITAAVLLTAAGTGAALGLATAADNVFRFDLPGRVALALFSLATLGCCVLSLIVKRVLEDRRDDYFAALVEHQFPQLNNQFINALQLGRGDQTGHSPVLIEAIVRDAAAATTDLDLADSIDTKPLRRAAVAAGLVALVLVGYAVVSWARFGNGLARVLLPFADIPPYSATQFVEVKPGDARFPEATSIPVVARLGGVVPSRAVLKRYDLAKGEWTSGELTRDPGDDDTFRHVLPPAYDSFEYYVEAGDGRSRRYKVTVEKRPQVMELGVTQTPPEYTGEPPTVVTTSDGKVVGVPGTRVRLALKASKPLSAARVVTENGHEVVLDRGEDARAWSAEFVLWAKDLKPKAEIPGAAVIGPTRYQIKLLDTQGYENLDPLWRDLVVIPDKAPAVTLTAPGRDRNAGPAETVNVRLTADDDFGVRRVTLFAQVREEKERPIHTMAVEKPGTKTVEVAFDWAVASAVKHADGKPLAGGDEVQYWAVADDWNDLTGPGVGESRRFTLYIVSPETADRQIRQAETTAEIVAELLRLQRENRAQTTSGVAFETLIGRQSGIRAKTTALARVMEKGLLPMTTVVKALDDLSAGPMADAVRVFEQGKAAADRADAARTESLPVQDRIIKGLEDILVRLTANVKAKEALKRLQKSDEAGAKKIADVLNKVIKDTDQLLKDKAELMSKLEKLPKKPTDEHNKEEVMKPTKELEEFAKRWEKWQKETVNELTKLPQGFADDFKNKPDANKIFEEIEKQATKAKAEKIDVSLEDNGVGLAEKMKEDLETWLGDAPDSTKFVMEEPLTKKPIQVPEMPLPKNLEDLVGDLLQKAEEFDEEADDTTSAWGDNLDQAGWGVGDGPIASFSAKGKTGNDLPNNMEMTGRSGDGRRGKSSGQMVGDTAKNLQGRKTPARLGNERYEPGQLKQEGSSDPNGSTGGGKKSGSGKKGLQGGTMPDFAKESGRLADKQAGIKEKADQIAKKLNADGVPAQRMAEFKKVWDSAEKDLRDLRYDDAAKKRRTALKILKGEVIETPGGVKEPLRKAKDLPPQLRNELMQASDEGYPAGYESLLKSYFKTLSTAEK